MNATMTNKLGFELIFNNKLQKVINCPLLIEWVYDSDFLFSPNQSKYFTTPHSPLPRFPDIKYYLLLTANKKTDGKSELQISLIFDTKYKNIQASADFTISLNEKEFVEKEFEFNNYGLHQTDCLFKFSSSDLGKPICINLKGNLFIRYISNPIFIKVDKDIRNLFKRHDEKDFVVCVSEENAINENGFVEIKKFKIHKSILQKYSTFFASFFEKGQQKDFIEINEFNPKIVKSVLNLCYGVTPKVPLSAEENLQLLKFCDTFGMKYVKAVIKKSIVLTPKNICEYTISALKNECREFFDECLDYLILCLQYSYPIENIESLANDMC